MRCCLEELVCTQFNVSITVMLGRTILPPTLTSLTSFPSGWSLTLGTCNNMWSSPKLTPFYCLSFFQNTDSPTTGWVIKEEGCRCKLSLFMLPQSPTNKIKGILLNSGPMAPCKQVSLSRNVPDLAYIKERKKSTPMWMERIYSSAICRVCKDLSSSSCLLQRRLLASGVQLTNRRNAEKVWPLPFSELWKESWVPLAGNCPQSCPCLGSPNTFSKLWTKVGFALPPLTPSW